MEPDHTDMNGTNFQHSSQLGVETHALILGETEPPPNFNFSWASPPGHQLVNPIISPSSYQTPANDEDKFVLNASAGLYVICGRWGCKVRKGFSLETPEVCILDSGRTVQVVQMKRNRAKIISPASYQIPANDEDKFVLNASAGLYVICGRWGCKVRKGFSLETPEVCILDSGRTVQVVQMKRNRAKIISPAVGWVSITSCHIEGFQILRRLDVENKLNSVDDLADAFSSIGTSSSCAVTRSPSLLRKKRGQFKKRLKERENRKKLLGSTEKLML